MGMESLNKSFRHTQSSFEILLKQYTGYGFTPTQIVQAWQTCKQNSQAFHDELIRISNNDNARLMSQEDMLKSAVKLKANLHRKEEDDLKKAILLSLDNKQPQDSLEDLLKSYRTVQKQPTGLQNLGNTCYMNITIQSLFHIVPFRNFILGLQVPENIDSNGKATILRLQELFAVMQSGCRVHVSPNQFFEALQKFKPNTMLVKGQQNDFYELQSAFLDALESGLKDVFGDEGVKAFTEVFYGQSEEILSYKDKDGESVRANKTAFGSINIDAKDGDLERGFRNSQLLIVDEFETPSGEKVRAKIEQNITKAPKVLQFYVNRVYYDLKQKQVVKNNLSFDFPKEINLGLFYKNQQQINQGDEFNKLAIEEQKCLDQLMRCGEDETELAEIFDRVIRLFKRSDESLNQMLTIDDFVVCEQNTLNGNLKSTADMIQQLELYRSAFVSRRQLLRKQMENIQNQKRELLQSKQNIYHLSAVLIHEGSAESGHYYCYVIDKKDPKIWWKCNDRVVTQVDYAQVYYDALGKNKVYGNASGLVYELCDWMNQQPIPKLQDRLSNLINTDREKLQVQIDQQKVNQRKGSIMYRVNQCQTPIAINNNDILQRVECYNKLELLLRETPLVYRYYSLLNAIKKEEEDMKSQLCYPEKWGQYTEAFIKESGLVDNLIQQEYTNQLKVFKRVNNYLVQIEKQNIFTVTPATFDLVIKQLEQSCTFASQYDKTLGNHFRFLYQAVILKGCFLCDLLVQKQDKSVNLLAKQVITANKNKSMIYPLVHQQVTENLKHTVGSMELLGNAFKDTISDINKGITIIPKSVLIFAEEAQYDDAIDISQYLNKLNSMINGLNLWIDFVKFIEQHKRIVEQQVRLNREMLLYFE